MWAFSRSELYSMKRDFEGYKFENGVHKLLFIDVNNYQYTAELFYHFKGKSNGIYWGDVSNVETDELITNVWLPMGSTNKESLEFIDMKLEEIPVSFNYNNKSIKCSKGYKPFIGVKEIKDINKD